VLSLLLESVVHSVWSFWWMLSIISVANNSRMGVGVVSTVVGECCWCRGWTASSTALSLISEIAGTRVSFW